MLSSGEAMRASLSCRIWSTRSSTDEGTSPELNIAYKMDVAEYKALTPYAADLEENWGPPPGNLNSDGQNLLVYGKTFGNIFIGVQPSFGYEGDPMRLLYAKSASPHHGFA